MTVSSGENREAAALAEQLSDTLPAAQQTEQSVPVHVVQAMRDEIRALKEKNEAFTNHLQMMQWQQPMQQQAQPTSPFQGKDLQDSITVEDALKGYSDLEQRFTAQFNELKMTAKTPDFDDTIRKYLPKAAQEDPELINEIKRSSNPHKVAYLAAKASKAYQEDLMNNYRQQPSAQPQKPKADPEAERMINNLKQSGNLTSVANNAKATGTHPTFSNMSDEEFRRYKSNIRFKPAKA